MFFQSFLNSFFGLFSTSNYFFCFLSFFSGDLDFSPFANLSSLSLYFLFIFSNSSWSLCFFSCRSAFLSLLSFWICFSSSSSYLLNCIWYLLTRNPMNIRAIIMAIPLVNLWYTIGFRQRKVTICVTFQSKGLLLWGQSIKSIHPRTFFFRLNLEATGTPL